MYDTHDLRAESQQETNRKPSRNQQEASKQPARNQQEANRKPESIQRDKQKRTQTDRQRDEKRSTREPEARAQTSLASPKRVLTAYFADKRVKPKQQETFRVIQSLRQSNHKHEESTRGKHRNNDLGFESYSNCALSVPIVKPGDGKSASSLLESESSCLKGLFALCEEMKSLSGLSGAHVWSDPPDLRLSVVFHFLTSKNMFL